MGTSRWSPEDWELYADRAKTMSSADLFRSRKIHEDLDPRNIVVRESCDSKENPLSTPIIVAVDETGSMGMLAETLIRNGLGVLIEEIYDRKPVSDPHVMCVAFGDAWADQAPLQVTQFEADIRLADQLSKFYIEGNGGGNNFESYNLPWYFAATRTKCDAFLKRNKKGYLFTVGDEPPAPKLLAEHVKKIFGSGLQRDLSTRDLYTMASKTWNIFHIMIEEGTYYRANPEKNKARLARPARRRSNHARRPYEVGGTDRLHIGSAERQRHRLCCRQLDWKHSPHNPQLATWDKTQQIERCTRVIAAEVKTGSVLSNRLQATRTKKQTKSESEK